MVHSRTFTSCCLSCLCVKVLLFQSAAEHWESSEQQKGSGGPSSPEGGADLDLSSGFGFHWSHQLVEVRDQLLSLVYELVSEPEVKAQEVGIIV